MVVDPCTDYNSLASHAELTILLWRHQVRVCRDRSSGKPAKAMTANQLWRNNKMSKGQERGKQGKVNKPKLTKKEKKEKKEKKKTTG
ncbi:MAG: hypothetical protein BroJett015_10110 [Chloroflexota bacterium]|nr:MAG: hypothetical protein BroJett015_10110 [Chloroflexota bacterium]